jgi:hypothetical protein
MQEGRPTSELELEKAQIANAFFIDFYSQWEGCDRETIKQAIRHFNQPEQIPSGMLPTRLAQGFRQVVDEMHLIRDRMSWLAEIDASNVAERVLAFLPSGTPLDSVIHITVDLFNNAFVHHNEMGVSLLKGATDRKTFEDAVTHELHHVGFRYWSDRDVARQALLQEKTGRAVAVMHVQNLLSEGMANYFCTPGYVFRESSKEPPSDPYQARLARLQREEHEFFTQAEAVLALSLKPDAEYEACWEAFKTIAFDMEEGMLPAGHYLGARMVQTMEQIHPRSPIVRCVQCLPEFLPLYNEAASKVGAFVFGAHLSEQFAQLWDIEKADWQ